MAIDFKSTQVTFSERVTGQEQSATTRVNFAFPVKNAEVMLAGFDLQFSDHHRPLKREMINISRTTPIGNDVEVEVKYLLRDGSGNIDDPYVGKVDLVVLASDYV
jgi:hypothetical protein